MTRDIVLRKKKAKSVEREIAEAMVIGEIRADRESNTADHNKDFRLFKVYVQL